MADARRKVPPPKNDPNPEADPVVKALTVQTDQLLAVGENYAVKDAADYTVAGQELQRVKAAQKQLEDVRMSMTRPLDETKRRIMSFFDGPKAKLLRAEQGIKRAMIAFQNEQDRKRREAQVRADEAARKERERLEEQARRAQEQGKPEKAEQLQQRAQQAVAPILQVETPKVAGVQTRRMWKFEVVNEAEVPAEFRSIDLSKIRKVVEALKGDAKIAGVRIWDEPAIAAGSSTELRRQAG